MSTPGKPDNENPNPKDENDAETTETSSVDDAQTGNTQPDDTETASSDNSSEDGQNSAPTEPEETVVTENNDKQVDTQLSPDGASDERPTQPAAEETPPPLPTRQSLPGGLFGLAILLLVASIVGGLIVSLWPSADAGRPSQTAGNLDNRLTSAESEIADLKNQLTETRNRTKAMETFMQSGDGAAVSEGTLNGLTELQTRLDALDEELAGLKATVPPVPVAPVSSGETPGQDLTPALTALRQDIETTTSEMTGRIAALEEIAPPADLEQTLQNLAPRSDIAALQDRMDTIEQDKSGTEAKQAAMALSLANLSRAIQSGQAFDAELETMKMLSPDISLLEGLQETATTGAPTKDQLTAQFADLAYTALQAERTQETTDWLGQLQANFDTVFSVRRTGDVEGDTTEAILARTEDRLKSGDLEAALNELSAIDGKAAEITAPWRQNAAARLKLDDFVEQLNNSVVEHLSQDGLNP